MLLNYSLQERRQILLNLGLYKAITERMEEVGSHTGGLKTRADLRDVGRAVYTGMTDTEKKLLGSKSKYLRVVQVLGRADTPTRERRGVRDEAGEGTKVVVPVPVGFVFETDVDLDVPVIPFSMVLRKVYDIIGYYRVEAGTRFMANSYEAFHMAIQPEFAGFFSHNGDSQGVWCEPRVNAWLKKEEIHPRPLFRLRGAKLSDVIVAINKLENGKWGVKPEYVANYGTLHDPDLDNKRRPISEEALASIKKMLDLQ